MKLKTPFQNYTLKFIGNQLILLKRIKIGAIRDLIIYCHLYYIGNTYY